MKIGWQRKPLTPLTRPFWRAYRLWLHHDCVDLSAAFAYHGLQSLFPLCLIALSLASRLLGRQEDLQQHLLAVLGGVFPAESILVVEAALDSFVRQGAGAGLAGLLILSLTASNAYLTLQRGADRLWWDRPWDAPLAGSWKSHVLRYLRLRVHALLSVGMLGLCLLAQQMLLRQRLLSVLHLGSWPLPPRLAELLALLLVVGAALVLLRTLPSRPLPWEAIWPGAIVLGVSTSLLNRLLTTLLPPLGLRFQAYGVVGGVLLFTLWVWLIGVLIYYAQCLSLTLWRSDRSCPFRMAEQQPAR